MNTACVKYALRHAGTAAVLGLFLRFLFLGAAWGATTPYGEGEIITVDRDGNFSNSANYSDAAVRNEHNDLYDVILSVTGYGKNSVDDVWNPDGNSNAAEWPISKVEKPTNAILAWGSGSNNEIIVDGYNLGSAGGSGNSHQNSVLGGLWWENAHDNVVKIINGAKVGHVYGGGAIGYVGGNSVSITGSTTNNVTGGAGLMASSGYEIQANSVSITDATVNGIVRGGWYEGGKQALTDDDTSNGMEPNGDSWVIGNTVSIGGSLTKITGNIYGGFNEGNHGTLSNEVNISGGTIELGNSTAAMIAGGYSSVRGTANMSAVYQNTVTISGGAKITFTKNNGTYLGVYGGRSQGGDVSVFQNTVDVNGGSITGGMVTGGSAGSAIASGSMVYNNTVTVRDGIIKNDISIVGTATTGAVAGGRVNDKGLGTFNTVNLLGGTVAGNVYGALDASNLQDATIHKNYVNVDGAEVEGDIFGGLAKGNTLATATDAASFMNAVNLSSGSVTGDVYGGAATTGRVESNEVNLLGMTANGDLYGGSADSGSVVSNVANLRSGTAQGNVYGGKSTTGTVESNEVNLSGGRAAKNVYGGSSGGGDVTGNAVNLGTSNVAGNIYAGYDENDSSINDVTNNSVVFSGGGDVAGTVYGTNLDTGWDAHKNTLSATGGLTQVGGISSFQSASILSAASVNVRGNGVAGTNPNAAFFHNLSNDGFLSFYNNEANQGVGKVSGVYTGSGRIGLELVWNEGRNPAETDSVIFENKPTAPVTFIFAPLPGSMAAPYVENIPNSLFAQSTGDDMLPFITTEEHGYGIYTYAFRSAENTDIGGYDYFVGLVDTHAGEIGKPHGDGSGTGLIQISMLADSFLRSGLEHAVAAINCRDGYGISASAEYAVREIDTGGGDTAGLNGLSGLVTFARTRLGTPITTGVFGEMFEGIYRTRGTHHVPHGEFSVRTGGVLRSYGGGAFVQYRQRLAEALSHNDFAAWMPGLHLEVTARMGWGIKDFEEESDSDDDEARKFGKTGTLYYGASLGGGYVFDPAPKFAVDVYGHASWVRQGGRKVTDNIGQHIEFSAADSLRLLAGVRAAYAAGERVRPYVGLAVDAEMVSRGPRVRVEGYEADRTKFSGVSALLELGVGIRAGGKTFIDIKASGSVGRHKSIAGLFEWRYEF